MSSTSVWLRNPDLQREDLIQNFAQLKLTLIHDDTSQWLLDIPADTEIADKVTWGWGIIVERNEQTLLSGNVLDLKTSKDATKNRLVLSGIDDTTLLDRLGFPCSWSDHGDGTVRFSSAATDSRTGAAETVMRAYVAANCTSGG